MVERARRDAPRVAELIRPLARVVRPRLKLMHGKIEVYEKNGELLLWVPAHSGKPALRFFLQQAAGRHRAVRGRGRQGSLNCYSGTFASGRY